VAFANTGLSSPLQWSLTNDQADERNLAGVYLSDSGVYVAKHKDSSSTASLLQVTSPTDTTGLIAIFDLTLVSSPKTNEVSARITAIRNKADTTDIVTVAFTYKDSTNKAVTSLFKLEKSPWSKVLVGQKRFHYPEMTSCLALNAGSDESIYALFQKSATNELHLVNINFADETYKTKSSKSLSWALTKIKAKFDKASADEFFVGARFMQPNFVYYSGLVMSSKQGRRRTTLFPTDWTAG